jgi:hypothetical protein
VVSFAVIMSAELGQRPCQKAFAEQDQLRQTLLLGGPNPTFRKSVQIWASGGKRGALHAARRQYRPKRRTEFRIAIVQNIAAGIKIAPSFLGRATGDLLHPLLIGMSGDPRHTDPSAFQMQEGVAFIIDIAGAKLRNAHLRLLTLLCSLQSGAGVRSATLNRCATHRKDGAGGAPVAHSLFSLCFLTYPRRFGLVGYTYREHKKSRAPSLNTFVRTRRGFGYSQQLTLVHPACERRTVFSANNWATGGCGSTMISAAAWRRKPND